MFFNHAKHSLPILSNIQQQQPKPAMPYAKPVYSDLKGKIEDRIF